MDKPPRMIHRTVTQDEADDDDAAPPGTSSRVPIDLTSDSSENEVVLVSTSPSFSKKLLSKQGTIATAPDVFDLTILLDDDSDDENSSLLLNSSPSSPGVVVNDGMDRLAFEDFKSPAKVLQLKTPTKQFVSPPSSDLSMNILEGSQKDIIEIDDDDSSTESDATDNPIFEEDRPTHTIDDSAKDEENEPPSDSLRLAEENEFQIIADISNAPDDSFEFFADVSGDSSPSPQKSEGGTVSTSSVASSPSSDVTKYRRSVQKSATEILQDFARLCNDPFLRHKRLEFEAVQILKDQYKLCFKQSTQQENETIFNEANGFVKELMMKDPSNPILYALSNTKAVWVIVMAIQNLQSVKDSTTLKATEVLLGLLSRSARYCKHNSEHPRLVIMERRMLQSLILSLEYQFTSQKPSLPVITNMLVVLEHVVSHPPDTKCAEANAELILFGVSRLLDGYESRDPDLVQATIDLLYTTISNLEEGTTFYHMNLATNLKNLSTGTNEESQAQKIASIMKAIDQCY